MKKLTAALLFTLCITSLLLGSSDSTLTKVDFSDLFTKYPDCSMTIYDLNIDHYYRFNEKLCSRQVIPASTFKISNTLIGLETGVIPDENFVIKWDGVQRDVDIWNKDHSLNTAFRNSVVWYYKELAKRVGPERMQQYLDKFNYGNRKITGGRNAFWLDGDLRISADEQIGFLLKLYNETLPVSKRSISILKDIMIADKTDSYTLRGKTGWAIIDGMNYGWYVGYLEQNGNVWFFAVNINSSNTEGFAADRVNIAKAALKKLGLL